MEAITTTLLLLLAMSTSNVSNDDVNNKLMESSTITDNNIGKLSWENIKAVEKQTIIELLRNEEATGK